MVHYKANTVPNEPVQNSEILSDRSIDVQVLHDVRNKPENCTFLNAQEYFNDTEHQDSPTPKLDDQVFMVTLLAAVATSEPPVSGYNYQQPANHNSYNSPTNSYLPPSTGFTSPSNNYLPPTFGSGSQNYDSGHDHGNGHNHGHGHDNEVPKSYEFGYSVKDAQSGNDYNRKESSDGNVVRGEYRVQLPDGRTQIVTYHADWQTGFHADVRYEGQAKYPEPTYNNRQGGYNYNAPTPNDFSGSLTGFHGNQGYKQPSTAYGPPGYH